MEQLTCSKQTGEEMAVLLASFARDIFSTVTLDLTTKWQLTEQYPGWPPQDGLSAVGLAKLGGT